MLDDEIPADRKPQACTALALKAVENLRPVFLRNGGTAVIDVQPVMIALVFETEGDDSRRSILDRVADEVPVNDPDPLDICVYDDPVDGNRTQPVVDLYPGKTHRGWDL
jgi:hypothetical protein